MVHPKETVLLRAEGENGVLAIYRSQSAAMEATGGNAKSSSHNTVTDMNVLIETYKECRKTMLFSLASFKEKHARELIRLGVHQVIVDDETVMTDAVRQILLWFNMDTTNPVDDDARSSGKYATSALGEDQLTNNISATASSSKRNVNNLDLNNTNASDSARLNNGTTIHVNIVVVHERCFVDVVVGVVAGVASVLMLIECFWEECFWDNLGVAHHFVANSVGLFASALLDFAKDKLFDWLWDRVF